MAQSKQPVTVSGDFGTDRVRKSGRFRAPQSLVIYHRGPVFTIGRAPFVAGAIHVRNQMRAFKQRERARRWKAFVERVCLLRGALLWRLSIRPGRTLAEASSPATAHA